LHFIKTLLKIWVCLKNVFVTFSEGIRKEYTAKKGFFQTAMELLANFEILQKCFTVKKTRKLDM